MNEDSSPNVTESTVRQIDNVEAEEAFTSYYLRQLTSEFSTDLDKLRTAADFNDRSVEILVEALKQGRSCFDKEQRLVIGRSLATN